MARKDFGAKPYTYPQPVFILATYNEDGTANAMNAAWGGISEGNEISFCISAGHKTTKNFQRTGAFTVSMADAKHVAACDYVGIESANNVAGKLDKAGFTVTKSANVDAPIINELAVCAECKVKSYDPESCRLVAEIVNVSVERAKRRGPFNIVGCMIFLILYHVLPESMYPYIGMIGGIGVGYSAGYAWQTVFNTFGALSIASGLFGAGTAVTLRIIFNVMGSV